MNKNLFRKESVDRLSSPEELDKLMQVTTPVGWLALLAAGLVIAAVTVWGFFGSIPITANGSGIFIKKGGVYEVVSETSGQIYEFGVKPGDNITVGQVIAKVRQPELTNLINSCRKELETLRKQHRLLFTNLKNSNLLNSNYSEIQKGAYLKRIEDTKRQLIWLKRKIEAQEELVKSGIIPISDMMTTRQQFDSAESDIKQFTSQIEQLSVQKSNSENTNQEKQLNYEKQIQEKESTLTELQAKHERNSVILSPFNGSVLSAMVDKGSVVQMNTPVINLSLTGKDEQKLSATTYVTAAEAKLIRKGMKAQISPIQAKKDEYGYMKGRVMNTSRFPSATEELMDLLHNKTLVDELTKGGAPFRVQVELEPDANDGYQWSSKRGGMISIDEGTRCNATFIVREQKPIDMVIPFIRRYLYGM
jgi:HlyD family secretion protein